MSLCNWRFFSRHKWFQKSVKIIREEIKGGKMEAKCDEQNSYKSFTYAITLP